MKRSTIGTVLVAGVLGIVTVTGFTACERKGPTERAGEKVDNAIDKAKDKLDPAGPAEKAGRKIDKAVNDNH
jgi:hypothetical protein